MHKGCPIKTLTRHPFLIKRGFKKMEDQFRWDAVYFTCTYIQGERKRAKKVFKYFFKVIHAWLVSYNWVTIQSW